MGHRGIIRSPSARSSRYRVTFNVPHERHRRLSDEAPPSGFADAGSHRPAEEAETPRERLEFLTHSATLGNVRNRISRATGIPADLLRGVCVHAQLKMYRGCGFDDRVLARAAEREDAEAKSLRRLLRESDRKRFRNDLAWVVAETLEMRLFTVMNANTCEFHELAVRAVCIKARRRRYLARV